MLKNKGDDFKNKKVAISGSGNVAQYACEKCIQLGAKVVTMSDSKGFIHDSDGIDKDKLAWIMNLKNKQRGRISQYIEKYPNSTFHEGEKPWSVAVDVALPCATQNELNEEQANLLVENGCIAVVEGANMPSTPEAITLFTNKKIFINYIKKALRIEPTNEKAWVYLIKFYLKANNITNSNTVSSSFVHICWSNTFKC